MAATAERQMNLTALQQRDPFITVIVDTASQVALYNFNSTSSEWEKTSVEGTLFVYSRSASPINGFMILNRLGLNDLIEPINRNLEFQLQDPFLLYRNEKASIFGIWFYDKDECARIGQLMNSLVQVAIETHDNRDSAVRQRRASESDSMVDRALPKCTSGETNGRSGLVTSGGGDPVSLMMGPSGARGNVDILQMLFKAQDEYDKSKPGFDPKPLIDNPNASATKSSDLVKPQALKVPMAQGASPGDMEPGGGAAFSGATAGASGSLEATSTSTLEKLFRQASLQQEPITAPSTSVPGGPPTGNMPILLQRLMSNTVEEIERQQHSGVPRDQTSGEEAPPGGVNGATYATMPGISQKGFPKHVPHKGPDSPNTVLKRSLNILPSVKPKDSTAPGTGIPLENLRTSTAPAAGELPQLRTYPMVPSLGPIHHPRGPPPSSFPVTPLRMASAPISVMSEPQTRPVGPEALGLPHVFPPTVPIREVRPGSGLDGEALITPQDLMQQHSMSHASSVIQHPNTCSISQAANVLLSPMAFQASRSIPPATTLHNPVGGDSRSFKSISPHDMSGMDVGGCLNRSSPAPSPTVGGGSSPTVTHLTKQQLQQAFVYLLKNDSQFLNNLHEAYVKSLNFELANRFSTLDRS